MEESSNLKHIISVNIQRAPQKELNKSKYKLPLVGIAGSKEAFPWPSQSLYNPRSICQQS
jgi:hypothetical protein